MQASEDAEATCNVARLCFVGCGNIAGEHLNAILAMKPFPRFKITCCVDPSPERTRAMVESIQTRFAEFPKFSYEHNPPQQFTSLEQALEADAVEEGGLFDAVDVMVPNCGRLHERVAVESLRAMKHTMLEKPIEVTLEAAQNIVDAHADAKKEQQADAAASAKPLVLMVAENAQYWPEVVAAQRMVEQGAIGHVLSARAKFWESAMGEWAGTGGDITQHI